MSQSVDNIIPVTINIKRSGIGPVSFGVALAAYGDATKAEDKGLQVYTDYKSLKEKHPSRTELLAVGENWFNTGGNTLYTFGYDENAVVKAATPSAAGIDVTPIPEPKTFKDALVAAADLAWFYFPFSTQTTDALTLSEHTAAAQWCEANTRFYMVTVNDEKAVDPSDSSDLGKGLKDLGLRRCAVCYSKKGDYLGVRVAGMMSMVNYMAPNSYKDAEYKSVGQAADDLSGTDILTLKAKGYFFNTDIAAKASKTGALLQNTRSTSTYNETIAEVMAIDSYYINLQNELLNVVTSQDNLPITPEGQQLAITAADNLGERYIDNRFLGQRQVTHPITKKTVVTRGYITTTVPEDVYKLTDAERGEHKLYPIEQYIYRAGSAWTVAATVNVW